MYIYTQIYTYRIHISSLCAQLLSRQVLWDPRTIAHQAPLSMGLSWQEYWSGLPFPPPGDLPDPGIKPTSLASLALAGGFLTTVPPGRYHLWVPAENRPCARTGGERTRCSPTVAKRQG